MADLYSRSAPDAPQPSLRMSSSEGIDRAERTVVLAHRTDSSPAVLQAGIDAAQHLGAALRVVHYAHDMTAGPTAEPEMIQRIKELSRPILEAGIEFEIQLVEQARHRQRDLHFRKTLAEAGVRTAAIG